VPAAFPFRQMKLALLTRRTEGHAKSQPIWFLICEMV
jgi:hypothetical protein